MTGLDHCAEVAMVNYHYFICMHYPLILVTESVLKVHWEPT